LAGQAVTEYRKKSIRSLRIIARRLIEPTIIFGTEKRDENNPIKLAITTKSSSLGRDMVRFVAHFIRNHRLFCSAALPPEGVAYPNQWKSSSVDGPKEDFEFQGIPLGGTKNP